MTQGVNPQALLTEVQRCVQVPVDRAPAGRAVVSTISQGQFSVYVTTIRASFAGREIPINFNKAVTLVLELPQDFRHAGVMHALSYEGVVTFLHAL